MNIRPARDSDFGDLARLHKASFAQAWDERALRDLIASGASALVAEQLKRIAGFILFRTAADEAEILTVAVAPDCRRAGMGRALVGGAAQAAARGGATRLFLEVGAGNTAARALYAGFGFAKTAERKGYYSVAGRAPEDALVLSAPLPLSGWGMSVL